MIQPDGGELVDRKLREEHRTSTCDRAKQSCLESDTETVEESVAKVMEKLKELKYL